MLPGLCQRCARGFQLLHTELHRISRSNYQLLDLSRILESKLGRENNVIIKIRLKSVVQWNAMGCWKQRSMRWRWRNIICKICVHLGFSISDWVVDLNLRLDLQYVIVSECICNHFELKEPTWAKACLQACDSHNHITIGHSKISTWVRHCPSLTTSKLQLVRVFQSTKVAVCCAWLECIEVHAELLRVLGQTQFGMMDV